MKLESKVFRDAANIYLWDGKTNKLRQFSCFGVHFCWSVLCI